MPKTTVEQTNEHTELVTDVFVNLDETRVLRKILELNKTSTQSHGGLRGLLGLTPGDADILVEFLRKI